MDAETLIINTITDNQDVMCAAHQDIIDDTLMKYRQHDYADLDELISTAKKSVQHTVPLINGCTTVLNIAIACDLSISGARNRLQNMVSSELISVDRSNRPFIFKLIDA